jgi:hypothetical protein
MQHPGEQDFNRKLLSYMFYDLSAPFCTSNDAQMPPIDPPAVARVEGCMLLGGHKTAIKQKIQRRRIECNEFTVFNILLCVNYLATVEYAAEIACRSSRLSNKQNVWCC